MRVNHRIKCRDKLRAPGAREKKQLLLEAMDRKEIPFSIVGDIKKAHRRFKHLAKSPSTMEGACAPRGGGPTIEGYWQKESAGLGSVPSYLTLLVPTLEALRS